MSEAPEVPGNVQPYVRALGLDRAVDFLLAFGGAPMSFARSPTHRSRVVEMVGMDGALALEREIGRAARVPIPKQWIVQYLRDVRGEGIHDIARRMHTSDESVRRWLAGRKVKSTQLSLL